MKTRNLFLSFLLLVGIVSAGAQDLMDKIPMDPEVRVGTLDNGARYYVRSNDKDPDRANFHIVYQVGGLQETDPQDGLAHFLEHMAFNGSKNFPGNGLIDYLQSIGIRFGENLNAGTAQQYTTYMITDVPIERETVVDSLLLALHDWAGFITLADKDIDEERGVIREELRQRNSAYTRFMEKNAAIEYPGSIVAERNVIGTDSLLQSFSYDDIRDFYNKWYRPDLQAFIIVGDFDADEMVEKLKKVMANVEPSAEKAPKEKIKIPYSETPKVGVFTDPEQTQYNISFGIQGKGLANKYNDTYMSAMNDMVDGVYYMAMNERFEDIIQKGNAPFMGAYSYHTDYGDMFGFGIDGYDGLYGTVIYESADKWEDAYKTLLTEVYRMQRYGITEGELERAKANILADMKRDMENADDHSNQYYVNQLESNFLSNRYIPSSEDKYEDGAKILENLTLEQVNATIASWVTDRGWTVLANLPEKEGEEVPTNEDLLAVLEQVKTSEIEAPANDIVKRPLITTELKGSPVAKTESGEFETTIWTLENGIKVIFKPSELKADELMLRGTQMGGTSKFTQTADQVNADFFDIVDQFGVGDFSSNELSKQLSGKIAGASKSLGQLSQGYSGNCSPKDAETMFQLLYLNAVEPRYDTTMFETIKTQVQSAYDNMQGTPDFVLSDSIAQTLYENPILGNSLTQEKIDMITLEGLKRVNDAAFSSAKDMVFTIVGNISADTLRPLVEKYIGSLPVGGETPKSGTTFNDIREGEITNRFATPMTSEKVTALVVYSGDWKYNQKQAIAMNMIGDIFQIRYTKSIREEQGGTYGVGTAMQKNDERGTYAQLMQFNTDESKIDVLLPIIYKEVNDLMKDGPQAEDLSKVKENYKKNYAEDQLSNGYWMGRINNHYIWEKDDQVNYNEVVDSIDGEYIKKIAKALFSQDNLITLVQLPE